jgi:Response regulator
MCTADTGGRIDDDDNATVDSNFASAPREPPPVVFVIDDHPGMRKSLRYLIETAGHHVETYATAREFLDRYDPAQRGCLVLDMRMPGMTGLDLLDELANRGDCRPAIMITGFGSVPSAVRAMKAGAIDFLEKPFDDQELLDRIEHGLQLDSVWRRWQSESVEIAARLAALSPREREILDQLVEGRRNKEIADDLGLSTATVADHRQRILKKMQARTALDLVRMLSVVRGAANPH